MLRVSLSCCGVSPRTLLGGEGEGSSFMSRVPGLGVELLFAYNVRVGQVPFLRLGVAKITYLMVQLGTVVKEGGTPYSIILACYAVQYSTSCSRETFSVLQRNTLWHYQPFDPTTLLTVARSKPSSGWLGKHMRVTLNRNGLNIHNTSKTPTFSPVSNRLGPLPGHFKTGGYIL